MKLDHFMQSRRGTTTTTRLHSNARKTAQSHIIRPECERRHAPSARRRRPSRASCPILGSVARASRPQGGRGHTRSIGSQEHGWRKAGGDIFFIEQVGRTDSRVQRAARSGAELVTGTVPASDLGAGFRSPDSRFRSRLGDLQTACHVPPAINAGYWARCQNGGVPAR